MEAILIISLVAVVLGILSIVAGIVVNIITTKKQKRLKENYSKMLEECSEEFVKLNLPSEMISVPVRISNVKNVSYSIKLQEIASKKIKTSRKTNKTRIISKKLKNNNFKYQHNYNNYKHEEGFAAWMKKRKAW